MVNEKGSVKGQITHTHGPWHFLRAGWEVLKTATPLQQQA